MPHSEVQPADEMRYVLGKTSIRSDFNLAEFLTDKNFTPARASIGGDEFVYYTAPQVDVSDLPFPRQARLIGSTKGDHIIIVPGEITPELQPIHAYRELIKAQMLEVEGLGILDEQIDLEVEIERRALSAVNDNRLVARYSQGRLEDTIARIRYIDELMETSLREGACDQGKIFQLDFVKDQLERAGRLLFAYSFRAVIPSEPSVFPVGGQMVS